MKAVVHAIRYVFAGLLGLGVNLGVFVLLTHLARTPYLLASISAFCIALVVSFIVQKFWTFADKRVEGLHIQFALFGAVALGNLCINTAIVYASVAWLDFHPLFGQILGSAIVALESFFVYRYIIFASPALQAP